MEFDAEFRGVFLVENKNLIYYKYPVKKLSETLRFTPKTLRLNETVLTKSGKSVSDQDSFKCFYSQSIFTTSAGILY